ncbi:MAG: RND transporter [Succiniclasticum sp.]|jgi:membrane fusion protein, multidrug efflux system
MQIRNKKTKILVLFLVVVLGIVAFRVVSNILARSRDARNSRQGKVAVVTAEYPQYRTITPKFRFSGSLDPVWQADVAAKVDGRIEKVLVEEGQAVEAGQALAVLDQADTAANLLNARGLYLDARTSYEKAQTDLDRYERLYKQGAVSRETLDNMRFAVENAKGKLDAAQGNLRLRESESRGTNLITPRAGIVQTRYHQEGYYAKTGTALFNVADISTLRAKIDVPEGYIGSVEPGGAVDFVIPSMKGQNKHVQGTITHISPVAEGASRTFAAEVSVDNRDGRLRGGVYADTTITAVPREHVLTVPLSAIVMRDDQRTVYIIQDGKAVRRVLRTGYIGDNLVEILEGVGPEDQVITGGQNKIREGSAVRVSGEKDS